MNKTALKKRKLRVAAFFFIFLFFFGFVDFEFRPMVKSISSNQARMITAEIVNSAILEDLISNSEDYSKITDLSVNEAGEVLAIKSNIEKLNRLKSHISVIIQKKFRELKSKEISVPLGTLSGIELLNGKGPPVPLKISASGSILTDCKSDFLSSGINQTLHRIYITVHTKISVMVPGCSCLAELDTTVPVAETVVVGKVPGFYGGNVPAGACTGNSDIPITKE